MRSNQPTFYWYLACSFFPASRLDVYLCIEKSNKILKIVRITSAVHTTCICQFTENDRERQRRVEYGVTKAEAK